MATAVFWRRDQELLDFLALLNSVIVATGITIFRCCFTTFMVRAVLSLFYPLVIHISSLPKFCFDKISLTITLKLCNTILLSPFTFSSFTTILYESSAEVEEAVTLDGASKWFSQVIVPMTQRIYSYFRFIVILRLAEWILFLAVITCLLYDNSRVLTVALTWFSVNHLNQYWYEAGCQLLLCGFTCLFYFRSFAKRIINSIGFYGIKW